MIQKLITLSVCFSFFFCQTSYSQSAEKISDINLEIGNSEYIFEGEILNIKMYPGDEYGNKLDNSNTNKDGFFVTENDSLAYGYSKSTIRINKIYKGKIDSSIVTIVTRTKNIIHYINKSKYTGKDSVFYKYRSVREQNKEDKKIFITRHLGLNCLFFTDEKFNPKVGFIFYNKIYDNQEDSKQRTMIYAFAGGDFSQIQSSFKTNYELTSFLGKFSNLDISNPNVKRQPKRPSYGLIKNLLTKDSVTIEYKKYLLTLNNLSKDEFIPYCYQYNTYPKYYNILFKTYTTRFNYTPYFDTSTVILKFRSRTFHTTDYDYSYSTYWIKERILNINKDSLNTKSIDEIIKVLNRNYYSNDGNYPKIYSSGQDPNGFLTNRRYVIDQTKENALFSTPTEYVFHIKDNRSDSIFIIPFDIKTSIYLSYLIGETNFLGGLNLLENDFDSVNTSLDDISNATYNAIITNNGIDLYNNFGITDKVAQEIPDISKYKDTSKSINYQNMYYQELYNKQNSIVYDINRLHYRINTINNNFMYQNPILIHQKPFIIEEKGNKFCALIMELSFGGSIRFIEIRCVMTSQGWRILDHIYRKPHNKEAREYINILKAK